MEKARKPYVKNIRPAKGFGLTRDTAPLPKKFYEFRPGENLILNTRQSEGVSFGNERPASPDTIRQTGTRNYALCGFCVMLIVSNEKHESAQRGEAYLAFAGMKMTRANIDSNILRGMLRQIELGENEVYQTGKYGNEEVTFILYRTLRGKLADLEFSPFGLPCRKA